MLLEYLQILIVGVTELCAYIVSDCQLEAAC
jgi:hypothetical protein